MSVGVCSARKFSCSELGSSALLGGRKNLEQKKKKTTNNKMPPFSLSLLAPESHFLLPSKLFLIPLND